MTVRVGNDTLNEQMAVLWINEAAGLHQRIVHHAVPAHVRASVRAVRRLGATMRSRVKHGVAPVQTDVASIDYALVMMQGQKRFVFH